MYLCQTFPHVVDIDKPYGLEKNNSNENFEATKNIFIAWLRRMFNKRPIHA